MPNEYVPNFLKLFNVEEVVGWINSQNYAEWTKRDKKLIQYAKHGSCDKDASYSPEVSWIRLGSIRAVSYTHLTLPTN